MVKPFFAFLAIALVSSQLCMSFQPPRVDNVELRRLMDLALLPPVSEEIGVLKTQATALKEILDKQKMPDLIKATIAFERKHGRSPRAGDRLFEMPVIDPQTVLPILTVEQWMRLAQLDLYREIDRIGYRSSIMAGLLNKQINLDPAKRLELDASLEELEQQAVIRISHVLSELQAAMLEELPPTERAKVAFALGRPFYFSEIRGLKMNEPTPKEEHASP